MNLAEAEANLFFIFYNKRIECYSNYCTCLIQLDANLNIGIHLYFLKQWLCANSLSHYSTYTVHTYKIHTYFPSLNSVINDSTI